MGGSGQWCQAGRRVPPQRAAWGCVGALCPHGDEGHSSHEQHTDPEPRGSWAGVRQPAGLLSWFYCTEISRGCPGSRQACLELGDVRLGKGVVLLMGDRGRVSVPNKNSAGPATHRVHGKMGSGGGAGPRMSQIRAGVPGPAASSSVE